MRIARLALVASLCASATAAVGHHHHQQHHSLLRGRYLQDEAATASPALDPTLITDGPKTTLGNKAADTEDVDVDIATETYDAAPSEATEETTEETFDEGQPAVPAEEVMASTEEMTEEEMEVVVTEIEGEGATTDETKAVEEVLVGLPAQDDTRDEEAGDPVKIVVEPEKGEGSSATEGDEVTCEYNGQTYSVGDTFVNAFMDADDCNTCTCFDSGLVGCSYILCDIVDPGVEEGGSDTTIPAEEVDETTTLPAEEVAVSEAVEDEAITTLAEEEEKEATSLPAEEEGDEATPLPDQEEGDEATALPAEKEGDEATPLPAEKEGDEAKTLPAEEEGDDTATLPAEAEEEATTLPAEEDANPPALPECTCQGMDGNMYCPGDIYTAPDGCQACKCGRDGVSICSMNRACLDKEGAMAIEDDEDCSCEGMGGVMYCRGDIYTGPENCQACKCGRDGVSICSINRACLDQEGAVSIEDDEECSCEGMGGVIYCPGDIYTAPDGCQACSCGRGGVSICSTNRACLEEGEVAIEDVDPTEESLPEEEPSEAAEGGDAPTVETGSDKEEAAEEAELTDDSEPLEENKSNEEKSTEEAETSSATASCFDGARVTIVFGVIGFAMDHL